MDGHDVDFAATGRHLKITGDGTLAGLDVATGAEGLVIAAGATGYFFLPATGAQTITALLKATFPGAAPTVTLVPTLLDHQTPQYGATAATPSGAPATGTGFAVQYTGNVGAEGCLLTIVAAAASAVTLQTAEYLAL